MAGESISRLPENQSANALSERKNRPTKGKKTALM
jgi:hypothetical protein